MSRSVSIKNVLLDANFKAPIDQGGTNATTAPNALTNLNGIALTAIDQANGVLGLNASNKVNNDKLQLPSSVYGPTVTGPSLMTVNETAIFTITNFDIETVYTITAVSGTLVSVVDEVITYQAPLTVIPAGFIINGRTINVALNGATLGQSVITSPTENETIPAYNSITLNTTPGAITGGITIGAAVWQFALDAAFTTGIITHVTPNINTVTFTDLSTILVPATTRFARVKHTTGTDGTGISSAYSTIRKFNVPSVVLTIAKPTITGAIEVLLSGGIFTSSAFSISPTGFENHVSTTWRVKNTSGGVIILNARSATELLSYTVNGLVNNTFYDITCQHHSATVDSAESDPFRFKALDSNLTTVATPVLSTSGTGLAVNIGFTTTAFSTDPAGAETHATTTWQVSTVSDFSSLYIDTTSVSSLVSATFNIPNVSTTVGGTYYIRCKHNASIHQSAWSNTITYTVNTPVIATPRINEPDLDFKYLVAVNNPQFQGSPFTIDNSDGRLWDHSRSSWEIATDVNFTDLVAFVYNTSYVLTTANFPNYFTYGTNHLGGLLGSTNYYIRCKYWNSILGWTAWSPARAFKTVDDIKTTPPEVLTPVNGSTDLNMLVTLTATDFAYSGGTATYRDTAFWLSTTWNFSSNNSWVISPPGTVTATVTLNPATTYYVKATSRFNTVSLGDVETGYGAVNYFTTKALQYPDQNWAMTNAPNLDYYPFTTETGNYDGSVNHPRDSAVLRSASNYDGSVNLLYYKNSTLPYKLVTVSGNSIYPVDWSWHTNDGYFSTFAVSPSGNTIVTSSLHDSVLPLKIDVRIIGKRDGTWQSLHYSIFNTTEQIVRCMKIVFVNDDKFYYLTSSEQRVYTKTGTDFQWGFELTLAPGMPSVDYEPYYYGLNTNYGTLDTNKAGDLLAVMIAGDLLNIRSGLDFGLEIRTPYGGSYSTDYNTLLSGIPEAGYHVIRTVTVPRGRSNRVIIGFSEIYAYSYKPIIIVILDFVNSWTRTNYIVIPSVATNSYAELISTVCSDKGTEIIVDHLLFDEAVGYTNLRRSTLYVENDNTWTLHKEYCLRSPTVSTNDAPVLSSISGDGTKSIVAFNSDNGTYTGTRYNFYD
jgi:hypothetical protein